MKKIIHKIDFSHRNEISIYFNVYIIYFSLLKVSKLIEFFYF